MWANSKVEELVQYNGGFKTKLIGTKEQIADRILLLKSLGVNLVLTSFCTTWTISMRVAERCAAGEEVGN